MIYKIISFIKDNQFLVAGLGVSSFGLISFWLKDVPLRIYSFIKRQITTDLTVQNYDTVFYELLKLIKIENKNKKFRTLKMNNGRWGNDDGIITSMGYGSHFIKFKNNILYATYKKEKDSISDKIKEEITLTKFGRGKKLFNDIINDMQVNVVQFIKNSFKVEYGRVEFLPDENAKWKSFKIYLKEK